MIYNLNSISNQLDEICEHVNEYNENNISMIVCAFDSDSGDCVRGAFGSGVDVVTAFALLASEFITGCAGDGIMAHRKVKKIKNEFIESLSQALDEALELESVSEKKS